MSYKYEKDTGDIVISGWERGISPSPHSGLGDLKCLNISSMPGEVQVNYARVQQSQQPITGGTFTANAGGGNTVNYTGTIPLLPGDWVTVTGSTISGLSNGVYFIKNNVSSNISLSTTFRGTLVSGLGTTGTATFTTFNMGKPIAFTYTNTENFPNYQYFVLDSNGLVWQNQSFTATGVTLATWSLLQTTPVSGATGIFCFGLYVFVAADNLYYKEIGNDTQLATGWATFKSITNGYPHPSVITPSGLLVLGDASQLDTLMAIGSFDPTNSATYTWQPGAVLLPGTDVANTLALIGNGSAATGGTGGATNILVGGLTNIIYPWAPGTSFFQPVVFVSESYIQQMVTVNNLVYIFAGSKGNIYITNGSSLTSVISVPDYVANSTGADQDPFFIWGGAMYLRGRIWFSVQAPNCGGIWSFIPTINYYPEQDTGTSLRLEHQNSYGTYAGMATILFAPQKTTDQNAEGVQYWAGWDDGTSGGSVNPYGIDFSSTTPYTSFSGGTGTSPYVGAAIIETDLIPIGTLLDKTSFSEIEYKLSAPLVSGENVGINYRPSATSAWLPLTLTQKETTNPISGIFIPTNNMQILQWVQLQVVLGSTATNPSYTRLTELRLR